MNNFHHFVAAKLSDSRLRSNYRRILDGVSSKKREEINTLNTEQGNPNYFNDLKDWGHHAKAKTIADLPALLETLEKNCTAKGIRVHYANDATEANALVSAVAQEHDAKLIIKGKSMISEEIHLNAHLIKQGYEVVESDLGEYILQIAGDLPSHLVMPAIHLVAQDFSERIRQTTPEHYLGEKDEEITEAVRNILRTKYLQADIGVSGVNFAVAETGSLVLVENEGNGRLTTSMPKVHIALMSMEKVVRSFSDVPAFLRLLTLSATGQVITNYINVINSPRGVEAPDGPEEVHLIILDNGRSRIYQDELLRKTLYCIRCGACMDSCPVYANVTGHAYQSEIPGPIGKIIMPQLRGLDQKAELPGFSSLCGACEEVCPVRIPIPKILLKLRAQLVDPQLDDGKTNKGHTLNMGKGRTYLESKLWYQWMDIHAEPKKYNRFRKWAGRFPSVNKLIFPWLPLLGKWAKHRSIPSLASVTLSELMRKNGNLKS